MGYFSSTDGKVHISAVHYLRQSDPVMNKLVKAIGVFRVPREAQTFRTLAEAIMSQQISGKAAASIIKRFRLLAPHRRFPRPEDVVAFSARQMRGAGLSRAKVTYIKDLARKTLSGYVAIRTLHTLSDEEVITHLIQVKGIGRWTAEMFLMFAMGRPDVFPTDDLGIQNALIRAYRLRKRPTKKRMLQIANGWRPYRTLASLYLWRSVDQVMGG
ncbi:MAG: DNA-3-methyladenine glycosylase [Patescibacteria group bacterium]|jgi:DNA-3-methyladenine glycosylase II